MNASNWIELLGLVLGGGGGGTAIAKLTRMAVSVETLAEKISTVADGVAKAGTQLQDHEVRLAKGGL